MLVVVGEYQDKFCFFQCSWQNLTQNFAYLFKFLTIWNVQLQKFIWCENSFSILLIWSTVGTATISEVLHDMSPFCGFWAHRMDWEAIARPLIHGWSTKSGAYLNQGISASQLFFRKYCLSLKKSSKSINHFIRSWSRTSIPTALLVLASVSEISTRTSREQSCSRS